MRPTPVIRTKIVRLLKFVVPISIAALVVFGLIRFKKEPPRRAITERSASVRVIRSRVTPVVPRVTSYGIAEPGRVWLAVAQVDGQIIERSPNVEAGGAVTTDMELAKIDPSEYKLAVAEDVASIASADADLASVQVKESNTKATLKVEKRALELANQELVRKQKLHKDGTISKGELDQEERSYLQQLSKTRDLENTLALIPSERTLIESNRDATQARLDTARWRLANTTITAPFDSRVAWAAYEETQFVRAGQELAELHGIEVAEISARVSLGRMRHLLAQDGRRLPFDQLIEDRQLTDLGLSARVRLRSGGLDTEWAGRVIRIETALEPATRTLGVVVAVDRPYEQIVPGIRPPIVQGMFMEVEITGAAKPKRILVPRLAVRNNTVLVSVNDRLERREVEIEFPVGDAVCLKSGLDDGALVIVSELSPAIDGQLLNPVLDETAEQRLSELATNAAGADQ